MTTRNGCTTRDTASRTAHSTSARVNPPHLPASTAVGAPTLQRSLPTEAESTSRDAVRRRRAQRRTGNSNTPSCQAWAFLGVEKSVGLVRWCSCENRCGHWWVTVPLLSLLSLSREQPPCEHYMSFVETILRCPRGVAVSSVPETAARVGQSRPSAAEFFCVHASRAVLKAAWSGIWDACVVTTHAPHPTRPRRLLHSKHTSHNCPTSLCLIVQSEIERLVPSIRRASALKG